MLLYFNQKARLRCIPCVSSFLLKAQTAKTRDVTTLTVFRREDAFSRPTHAHAYIYVQREHLSRIDSYGSARQSEAAPEC